MLEISVLLRDPRELAAHFLVCGYCEKTAAYEEGPPRQKSSSTIILDFLAPGAVRNKCLLFIRRLVCGIFVITAWID